MLVGILDHAQRGGEGRDAGAGETVEGGVEQGLEDLAGAVGAEVGHDDGVAIGHTGVVADDSWDDELVAGVGGVGLIDGGGGVGRGGAVGVDQGVVGEGDTVPPLVAVHGVVAAGHGGDADVRRGEGGEEIIHEAAGALRRGIAAVEEGVDGDGHAGAGDGVGDGGDVVLHGMDAAGGNQAHEVGGAAGGAQLGDDVLKGGVGGEFAVGDGVGDARQFLFNDAAGADGHVADLRIAHLAVGQADGAAGGGEQSKRAGAADAVPNGGRCLPNRVVGGIRVVAPAIEDAQQDGSRHQALRCKVVGPVNRGQVGGFARHYIALKLALGIGRAGSIAR